MAPLFFLLFGILVLFAGAYALFNPGKFRISKGVYTRGFNEKYGKSSAVLLVKRITSIILIIGGAALILMYFGVI